MSRFSIVASVVCFLTLRSVLGFEYGQWNTDNSLSLILEASRTGRPVLAVITKSSGCENCQDWQERFMSDKRFEQLSTTYSCYLWKIDATHVDSPRLFINRYFPGTSSYPGMSLLNNTQEVDTQYNYATWSHKTVDDLLSDIEERLKRMSRNGTTHIYTGTNTTVTIDHSLITIERPTSVTEGDTIRLKFRRSGFVDDALVLHIITNGFFCANVSWASRESGEKIMSVPTAITPEYDDNRAIEFMIKTLYRRVATEEITDYSYLTGILTSGRDRKYGPCVTQETVTAWLDSRTEDAVPCQWSRSPVLTLQRAKETGFPALFFLTGKQGKGCANKRSEIGGFNINLNLQSTCDVINDYNTIYLCYSNNEDDWKSIKSELHIDDWTETLWKDGYTTFEGTNWKMYMPFILLIQADSSGINTIFAIQRSKYEPKYSPYATEIPLTELSEKTQAELNSGTYCCKTCLFGRGNSMINHVSTSGQFAPFLDEYLNRYTTKNVVENTDTTTNATQFILHRNNVLQRFTVNLTDILWIGYPTFLEQYPIDCLRVISGQWWIDKDYCLRAHNPVGYPSDLSATCFPTNSGTMKFTWQDNVPITFVKSVVTNIVDDFEYEYWDTGLDKCISVNTNAVFSDTRTILTTTIHTNAFDVHLSADELIRLDPHGSVKFTTFDFIPD